MIRRVFAGLLALPLAGFACAAQVLPLPDGLAVARDLRAPYRAAFCARSQDGTTACDGSLRTFAGEGTAPRPKPARAGGYRLLFVPGFLATCFPGIHSFADMIEAARGEGFLTDTLAIGGRNGVAANARLLAGQVDRLPVEERRFVFVTHSKGAADVLALLAARPDIAARTQAVLTFAGALNGSPLADDLRGLYAVTLAMFPFSGCDRGEGDPVGDLTAASRAAFWAGDALRTHVPIYSIVAMPHLAGLSPAVLLTYLRLAHVGGSNDGMLLVRDQLVPGAALLGIVDADHLRVAIPFPGPAYVALFNAQPLPRGALLLAAIDVIASEAAGAARPMEPEPRMRAAAWR